jgi:small-conductance mechanosensitive channel
VTSYVLVFLLAVCTAAHAAPDGADTPSRPATLPALPAQVQPATAPTPTVAPAVDASLVVFNREVFVFRGALSGYSSADRARRAKTRIEDLLELGGPNHVALVHDALGLMLQVDGATVFLITPLDVDSSRGETLEALGERTLRAMEVVLTESREARDLDSMLRASAWALGASALALALAWLAARIRRRLRRSLQGLLSQHGERLQLAGVPVLQSERAGQLVQLLLNTLYQLFLFVLAYNWLSWVLSRFPFTRAWGEALSGYLLDLVGNLATAMLHALPGLATALLIFWLARGFNRALGQLFDRVQSGQLQLAWLDADVVVPTRRISTVLVWLFALAMAYPNLPGSGTEAFKGLSVLVGLMISLGASNLVGQAASGLILTYGRVFRKGEYVRVAEHEGTVTEMGMFATRIRTGLGEELTISNSKILDSSTKNYSRAVKGAGYVLDTTVTIGYDTAWRQVHAMLVQAARRTEGVLADPAPVVFQTTLSDWYPEYRLVCQATASDPRPRALVLSQLHANIQDVFNEYGVQIMSPQYFEDPASPKVVPPAQWYPAPAQRADAPTAT